MMDRFPDDPLVRAITDYVRNHMRNYDASHGFDHIERVVGLSHYIYGQLGRDDLDLRVIHLAALLHDVGDRKYLRPGEDSTVMVREALVSHGAGEELATRIQTICSAVSYSTEIADPARNAALVATHPELAVVQDADRLDSLGAVGLGRLFTFDGAHPEFRTENGEGAPPATMAASMEHLDEKLLGLAAMAKTPPGRELARKRVERLQVFREWWVEELGFSG